MEQKCAFFNENNISAKIPPLLPIDFDSSESVCVLDLLVCALNGQMFIVFPLCD